MIFNAIEKGLREFSHSGNKLKKQCSINYNPVEIEKKTGQSRIFPKIVNCQQPKLLRECVPYELKYQRRALKPLSPQLTFPTSRSNRNKNKFNLKQLSPTAQRRQQGILQRRCHPQKYNRSQNITPRKYEHNNRYNLSGIVVHQPLDLRISNTREKENQLSRTAVTTGSELYELSPIHFSKYMEFKEKNQLQAKKSNDETKAGFFYCKIEQNMSTPIESQIKMVAKKNSQQASLPSSLQIHRHYQQEQQKKIEECITLTQKKESILQKSNNMVSNVWIYLLIVSGVVICVFELIK